MTPPIQTTQQRKHVTQAPEVPATGDTPVAQFFIFKGVTFIGQDCFSQERICIGSSPQMDLVLEGQGVAEVQAYVYLKEGQVIISDRTTNGVRVNGTFQKTAMLQPLDLVDIGPYTLKIKAVREGAPKPAASRTESQLPPTPKAETPSEISPSSSRPLGSDDAQAASGAVQTPDTAAADTSDDNSDEAFADFFQFYADPATVNYDLVFYGQMKPSADPKRVKVGLQQLFRTGPQQIEGLFRQPRVVIKKNLAYRKAQQLKSVFEKTGAQCHLEPVDDGALKVDDFDPDIHDTPPTAQEPENLGVAEAPTERSQSNGLPAPLCPDDLTGHSAQRSSSPAIPMVGSPSTSDDTTELDDAAPGAGNAETAPDQEPLLVLAEEEVTERDDAVDDVDTDTQRTPPDASTSAPIPKNPFATVGIYDDDDEEDEDEEADFQLLDKLNADGVGPRLDGDTQLQVVKLRNDQVLDIRYLKKRQRYAIECQGRKHLLVENRRNAPGVFYFSEHLTGRVESAGEGVTSTRRLMQDMKPWRKRQNLFRREMPTDGCVLLHDGDFEYRLTVCDLTPAPEVKLPPKEKRHPYKHAATSFVFHLVFIAFLGLVPSFNADDGEPESHFVQLDQDQLAELEKIIQPKPKPKKPTPPPPKKVEPPPKPVVKKKTPVTKVKPNRVAAKKKKKGAKVASASRHPKAGGGFGKGNVVNRDVNQTGLLSMLGDSVGFQPQAAVAAVTNLDAVSAPGSGSQAKFKVGGIVGKLGTENISVPTGGIVATKGSKQVLRSIGASGPGKVAALEKGKAGDRQVAGTVTASLTKSVLIGGGGMSRQAVKKVIDQHLDEITYCYETALITNPSIMGKMIFEWKILMNGEVGEVRIKSSTVNSHEIHACIKAAIKTWQFPKPKGSTVVVSYPFIFDVVGF